MPNHNKRFSGNTTLADNRFDYLASPVYGSHFSLVHSTGVPCMEAFFLVSTPLYLRSTQVWYMPVQAST
jgi:hypothetical protein